MKKAFILVAVCAVLAFVVLFLSGRSMGDEKSEAFRAREKDRRVLRLSILVSSIQYIKDSRTGLCFAYYYGGGPALATVPCEAIPPKMLTVTKPPSQVD